MAGYLLDTSVVLVTLKGPKRLPGSVRKAARGPNFLSVVSYWEVLVKSMKGNLEVGDPRNWWKRALRDLDATPLDLTERHVAEVYNLPPIHQDPFDRMLIAQAMTEGLALVTIDQDIARYASERLRVVS